MLEFFQYTRDGSDIHRFPACHVVRAHFLLEDHGISELSLGMLEKFQRSSKLENVMLLQGVTTIYV